MQEGWEGGTNPTGVNWDELGLGFGEWDPASLCRSSSPSLIHSLDSKSCSLLLNSCFGWLVLVFFPFQFIHSQEFPGRGKLSIPSLSSLEGIFWTFAAPEIINSPFHCAEFWRIQSWSLWSKRFLFIFFFPWVNEGIF